MTLGSVSLLALATIGLSAAGYAECNSEIKDDTSVKTGPVLYDLFPTTAARAQFQFPAGANSSVTAKS